MKKFWNKSLLGLLFLGLTVITLAGCGKSSSSDKTVKLGIVGSDQRIWKPVAQELKKKGINLEIVSFTDYSQPNAALQNGQTDINSFQNQAFLDSWNKSHKSNLVNIGDTIIAPMALYSEKVKSLSQLKNGDSIAIQNDSTNEGRALHLLQSAGLIKLDNSALPTPKNITENKKHLKFVELDASQTVRSMKDTTAAVVNSGFALDAKLPDSEIIYHEPITKDSKPYINVIAANSKNKNDKVLKEVVKTYQTEKTKKLIDKIYEGKQKAAWNLKIK